MFSAFTNIRKSTHLVGRGAALTSAVDLVGAASASNGSRSSSSSSAKANGSVPRNGSLGSLSACNEFDMVKMTTPKPVFNGKSRSSLSFRPPSPDFTQQHEENVQYLFDNWQLVHGKGELNNNKGEANGEVHSPQLKFGTASPRPIYKAFSTGDSVYYQETPHGSLESLEAFDIDNWIADRLHKKYTEV